MRISDIAASLSLLAGEIVSDPGLVWAVFCVEWWNNLYIVQCDMTDVFAQNTFDISP